MVTATLRRRYRSVFLSDVHLGARACRAEALLAFLDATECERLYLLGDIVDGWRLERRWFWPAAHAAVVDRILAMTKSGVEVIYVPGNHDAFARSHDGFNAQGVSITTEAEYLAADGRRYLLAHGDAYDPGARRGAAARWAADVGYRGLMRLDGAGRWTFGGLGLGEASLAAWAKRRSGLGRRVVARFEIALAAEARRRGFEGVVCGHIHSAGAKEIDGIAYINCGDWVETCSAVVETASGELDVLHCRGDVQRRERRMKVLEVPAWSA